MRTPKEDKLIVFSKCATFFLATDTDKRQTEPVMPDASGGAGLKQVGRQGASDARAQFDHAGGSMMVDPATPAAGTRGTGRTGSRGVALAPLSNNQTVHGAAPQTDQKAGEKAIATPGGAEKHSPGLAPDAASVGSTFANSLEAKNASKTIPGDRGAVAADFSGAGAGANPAAQAPSVPAQPGAADVKAPTEPNANAVAAGNAPVHPNAPVDPNAPLKPGAPVDPNSPVDPNAPTQPGTPVDPNALPKPGVLGDANALSGTMGGDAKFQAVAAIAMGGATNAAAAGAAVLAHANGTNATTVWNQRLPAIVGQLKLAQVSAAHSNCTEPLIRKEYSTLTRQEKKAFVEAVKCVRSKPSRFKTSTPGWNAADDWTLLHIRMVKYVHFTAYFLPFHRGFTVLVQRDLNECGFALGLPWIDWTKTSQDPSMNGIWDPDPEVGLGTDGKGDSKDCPWQSGLAVTDGALADHFFNAPRRHRLCRQFNNLDVKSPNAHFGPNCTTFINADFIKGLGATHDNGKFFDFSSALEISTHLSMHTCVGGNLAWLSSSPNDMAFHSHHATLDNVFDAWRKKNDANQMAFHGPKQQQKRGQHPPWTAQKTDVINFEPLAPNVMVQDLLDPESGKWGGRMCYRYDYNIAM